MSFFGCLVLDNGGRGWQNCGSLCSNMLLGSPRGAVIRILWALLYVGFRAWFFTLGMMCLMSQIRGWIKDGGLIFKIYILLPIEVEISASHFPPKRTNCAFVRLKGGGEGWGGSPLSTVRWSVPWLWHRGLTYSACLGPAGLCKTHAAPLWRRR